MGKIVASVIFCFAVLFFFCVIGTSATLPGIVGAVLIAATTFAAADMAVYLWRNPLQPMVKRLLEGKFREPAAILMMLISLNMVALPAAVLIWSWAHLYPEAFVVTAQHALPSTVGEALRLGFTAAVLDGLLWLIKFPCRFGGVFRELIAGYDK
jgi:hypothetical protein